MHVSVNTKAKEPELGDSKRVKKCTHTLFLFNLKICRICINVPPPEIECRSVWFTAVEGYS